jgi:hypothetical protein
MGTNDTKVVSMEIELLRLRLRLRLMFGVHRETRQHPLPQFRGN